MLPRFLQHWSGRNIKTKAWRHPRSCGNEAEENVKRVRNTGSAWTWGWASGRTQLLGTMTSRSWGCRLTPSKVIWETTHRGKSLGAHITISPLLTEGLRPPKNWTDQYGLALANFSPSGTLTRPLLCCMLPVTNEKWYRSRLLSVNHYSWQKDRAWWCHSPAPPSCLAETGLCPEIQMLSLPTPYRPDF